MSLRSVCIVGAGAIGGWIGTRLAIAGCSVSVVARGATLDALQLHGLRLHQGGDLLHAPVRATADANEIGPQDLVVVAVKTPAMTAVAQAIGPLLGPDTMVLTAMNGVPWWFFNGFGGRYAGTQLDAVDPGGEIARHIPAQHVVGGVVHAACSMDRPGVVRHHFGNKLVVGEPAGAATPRLRALGDLLTKAGFEAVLSEQIQRDVWFKLWGNLTMNPVSALTGATTDRVLADPLVRDFISRVMLEAREIGARIGAPIDQQPEDRHQVTRKLGAFKTSMLQDVEARRPVELDALVTVVKDLGTLTGVETPFTDALLGLARLQARGLGLYPAPGPTPTQPAGA